LVKISYRNRLRADNIKVDTRDIGSKDVNWVELAQNAAERLASLITFLRLFY